MRQVTPNSKLLLNNKSCLWAKLHDGEKAASSDFTTLIAEIWKLEHGDLRDVCVDDW